MNEDEMFKLRVRKFGNSVGIILPKKIIQRLNVGIGDSLILIEVADRAYQLRPDDSAFEKKMAKAKGIIGRYCNTLHTLANWRS